MAVTEVHVHAHVGCQVSSRHNRPSSVARPPSPPLLSALLPRLQLRLTESPRSAAMATAGIKCGACKQLMLDDDGQPRTSCAHQCKNKTCKASLAIQNIPLPWATADTARYGVSKY